jgi:hypothetical protein
MFFMEEGVRGRRPPLPSSLLHKKHGVEGAKMFHGSNIITTLFTFQYKN